MKKLAFFSILALAMTAFACDDSDKKGGENNGPQDEWTGGTVEQKADFFIKKAAEKTLACAEANANHNIASDNMDVLRENAKGILSDPMMLEDPYASCMSKMADYFECEASLDCDGLFKIWSEDEEDYGKCEAANEEWETCIENASPMNLDQLVDDYKEMDKAIAKKELECAKAISDFDADALEDINNRADGSEDYTYVWTKPYRVCLNSYVKYNECKTKLSCDILMQFYDGEDNPNHGDCQSLADKVTECMDDTKNVASDVEQLCLDRSSCKNHNGEVNHNTKDEILMCADEDEKLTDANCRSAKNAYYTCIKNLDKSPCEVISVEDCAEQLAAEKTACNPDA